MQADGLGIESDCPVTDLAEAPGHGEVFYRLSADPLDACHRMALPEST